LVDNREVTVIRLISKDTVEEGMLRCARDKLKLEKDITTDESKSGAKIQGVTKVPHIH
jgi:SWI/SNF-related matrix-associated actin-dependent regulator 1 of chromatin subfamily A